jgi:hypothetical protein
MGQPTPPQGNQTPHTERPLKVYAEQYLAGQPLPIGATTETLNPLYADGRPHVILATGVVRDLHETDWIISNRYTGQPVEVISAEEMAERFGPGGAP